MIGPRQLRPWGPRPGGSVGSGLRLGVLGLLAFVSGCELMALDCHQEAVWAVRIEVVDSLTGSLMAHEATGVLVDGAYVDTMVIADFNEVMGSSRFLVGASERPGTYQASISAEGYLPWTRVLTAAPRGSSACHLRPAQAVARMAPA